MPSKRFILTTGGTGGHIFPAIAVAREIQQLMPDAEILFVGAKGGMENTMVPDAGFKILSVTVSGFARRLTLKNLIRNLSFPLRYLQGLWEASRILRIYQPDVVIGFGGYASAPALRMAVSLNVPTALHESNAYPGIVTRLMSSKVKEVLIGNEAVLHYLKIMRYRFTGNPIRSTLLTGDKAAGLLAYGFESSKPVVFLTGGSLGALSLNEAMAASVESLVAANCQVIWQCGSRYAERYQKAFAHLKGLVVAPFISNMADTYACADVVISRAGAMTVSEITALRKPAILVPSPNVAEDHQTRNAESLTRKGAAILVKDAEVRDALSGEILRLLNNKELYQTVQSALEAMSVPNATQEIARVVIALAERRNPNV
jgi:UDP-N-acetylglucosamine--N-acetylmuramyl-(pentapeptide) pyrophosphoryl-undecaprenol N-acetylglucosamine transferase